MEGIGGDQGADGPEVPGSVAGGPARLDFQGQVVVVTGGTRGVGRAICEAFLGAGAAVVTCGRRAVGAGGLPQATGPTGEAVRADFVVADVREPDQAAALVARAQETYGRLDVVVNNAGGSPPGEAARVSPRFVEAVIALNLLAPFYVAQAAHRVFAAQASGGVIVNIGSISALRPSPGTAAYGAAKAGLVSLTETLAVEWAPQVRVNCVSAGLLDTGAGPEHYGGPEQMAEVAATVPLGRMGSPQDIAGICLFLASPLAAFVTGANLVAHGGGEWPAFLAAARTTPGGPGLSRTPT